MLPSALSRIIAAAGTLFAAVAAPFGGYKDQKQKKQDQHHQNDAEQGASEKLLHLEEGIEYIGTLNILRGYQIDGTVFGIADEHLGRAQFLPLFDGSIGGGHRIHFVGHLAQIGVIVKQKFAVGRSHQLGMLFAGGKADGHFLDGGVG